MQGLCKEKEKDRGRWFLFLLGCLLSINTMVAQSDVKAKNITYQCKNEQLSKALRQVERLSEYYRLQFAYEDVEKYTVSVTLKDATVQTALSKLLQNTDLNYEINGRFVQVFKSQVKSSSGIIRGIILDEEGEPLVGVAIRNKDNSGGTITDISGKFQLSEKKKVRLVISYIGKQTLEYDAKPGDYLRLVLKDDSKLLEDVVVTGYQVIDKRELTSSIETITADELDKIGALTVDQMLEGKATGLMVANLSSTPGAASKVRVRSGGTFTGSRAPLWVVDGVIYEDPVPLTADEINSFDSVNLIGNALTGLNPQDIESINILKDASATAIYGTRAANGVIVVTTKRGKKGRASLSYSGSVQVTERPSYSDFNLMNSKERVDVSREIAQKNLGYPSEIYTWVGYEKALRDYRSGEIDYAQFLNEVANAETMNTDWFDELYRPAINTTHNANLSGGTDNMRYYFSVGYNNQQGTERNVNLDRITARANIDVNFRKNLILTLGMNGSVQDAKYNHSSINLFDEAYYNSRTFPIRNSDGSLYYLSEMLTSHSGHTNYLKYNVLEEMANSERNITNKDFSINAQLNWTIARGIKLLASASYRNTTNLQEEWSTDNTRFVTSLRTYDEVEDMIADWEKRYSTVPFGGLYSSGMTSQESWRGQAQLNLSKVLAQKHVFNLNLGYEVNSNVYKGSSGWTAPGYNHEQGRSFITLPNVSLDASTGDLVNYGYVNMIKWLTSQGGYNIYPSITDRTSNSLSMFGIFNYTYDNRYIFNFNIRSDGSNQFGQYERYKFKPTWSVSGRWNIHNEKFWSNNEDVEELAVRLSYGFRGNPPSQVPYMIIANYIFDSDFGENIAYMANYPNSSLTWEKTSTFNAGLNFSLWKGRLSGSFDFAYSHGTDLLLSRPVSLVNGQGTQLYNGGEKKDYSYELSLSGKIIDTKNWGWRVSANATMTKEEVLAGYEAENTTLDVNDYLGGSIYLTGFPVDAFYSYQFDGLDENGLPKFKNLENRSSNLYDLMSQVLTYSGRRTPTVYGGFNTEIRYKRLTLRSSFTYKAGHHTRLLALYKSKQSMPMPTENMRGEFINRWRQPGDEAWAVVPGLSDVNLGISTSGGSYFVIQDRSIIPTGVTGYTLYNYSDLRVARADYIRWQNLSLSYSFPERIIKALKINNLQLTAQMSNIAVWAFDDKLKGQDPEQVEGIGIPALPSYAVSVNFSF